VVAYIPVAKDDRWRHPLSGRQEAIVEEADVVYCPSTGPLNCGYVPSVLEDFEGARPITGKALGTNECLVQIAHQEDGAIGELGVDLDKCRAELGTDPLALVIVGEVDTANDEGARQPGTGELAEDPMGQSWAN
jgi:hypothetical protein